MKKLSEQQYWDEIFSASQSKALAKPTGLKAVIKKILGERGIMIIRGYGSVQLWERIYARHLPAGPALKAVEIGSAPGNFMVDVHRKLHYDVYGIEYTDAGADLNRRVFAASGIDPRNVFHEDFLSEKFHADFKDYFDVVFSRGFIEHFDDVRRIIDLHINLLKPGGTLAISIPRFRGLNWLLMAFFNKPNLDIHNLKIMKKSEFVKLFQDDRLEQKFCDYFGTFNLGLFNTKPKSFKRYIHKLGIYCQRGLNVLFYLLLRRRGLENPLTSPYLMYIGVKKM